MSEFTFERLAVAERTMRADEQREAARAAAEEAWVDERVAEGERLASRPVDGGGGERKPDSTGTARWHEALAPWGLTLAAAGAVGGGGRGLVTTRSFKRGEVLMRVTPAVAVVSGRHLSSRCHHSHATGGRLLVCSRCGCARYCSADHQRAAWAGHRDECALLAQTRPRVPGQTVRLLARLLALLRRSAGAPPPEDAGEWARSAAAILSLSHQLSGQPAERCAEFGEQAGMVCSLIQEAARSGGGWAGSSSCPPQEQVASLLSLLSLNAHAICDAELQATGPTCRGPTCRGSTCRGSTCRECSAERRTGPFPRHASLPPARRRSASASTRLQPSQTTTATRRQPSPLVRRAS